MGRSVLQQDGNVLIAYHIARSAGIELTYMSWMSLICLECRKSSRQALFCLDQLVFALFTPTGLKYPSPSRFHLRLHVLDFLVDGREMISFCCTKPTLSRKRDVIFSCCVCDYHRTYTFLSELFPRTSLWIPVFPFQVLRGRFL